MTLTEETELYLTKMIEEHRGLNPRLTIRPDTLAALSHYVLYGLPPGQFLTAVLENNLMGAMGHADSYNRATLFQICQYVYNDMPSNCHGSVEAVAKWMRIKKREGVKNE